MKDVYQFRELMENMSRVDEKFDKRIHVANDVLLRFIEPFLKNLLNLPVSKMNRIAWITWPFRSDFNDFFDEKSNDIRRKTNECIASSNDENVYNSSQVASNVKHTQNI